MVRIVVYSLSFGIVWFFRGVSLDFFIRNLREVFLNLFVIWRYVIVVIVCFDVFEKIWIFMWWVKEMEVVIIIWGILKLLIDCNELI